MTKEILIQYADMQEEVKDLQRRIASTRKKLEELRTGGTVIDSVRGTREDGTFGSIRIEGFPFMKYDRQREALLCYINKLQQKEAELLELLNKSEKFIETIQDSRLRMIVRLRIVDDLTWQQVARRIGGGNTPDGVRMIFNRFFDEKR